MNIIRTVSEMQECSRRARLAGKRIGVVPTMGYLHDGHLSLVDRAREAADFVVVTIFVNPTQFGPFEDLSKYPRDFERDCALCAEHGVDVVFAPEPKDMYFPKHTTWVVEESLTADLCGNSRPNHFRGVTTVVAKLFNAVLPDVAVFGQKDAQQALVIRRMVRDLNFPIEILVAPLVREADGLAMSSRNRYLSGDERRRALSVSRTLLGLTRDKLNADTIWDSITRAGGRVDYVEIRDAETLGEVTAETRDILVAVAAFFGATRLIDNVILSK
jgi:pantoate--beta-alanine ligase